MSNQTALTDTEVVDIANEMGVKYDCRIGKFEYWTIQGYEIVRNYQTGEYTIKFDGDVLTEGRGGIKDALRDFITAES